MLFRKRNIDQLSKLIAVIQDDFRRSENLILRLREDNEALRSKHYKDDQLKRLQADLDKARSMTSVGFCVTNEQQQRIEEWKRSHVNQLNAKKNRECCEKAGAIGGRFTYCFTPTSIGTVGTVRCSCGAEYCFNEL